MEVLSMEVLFDGSMMAGSGCTDSETRALLQVRMKRSTFTAHAKGYQQKSVHM